MRSDDLFVDAQRHNRPNRAGPIALSLGLIGVLGLVARRSFQDNASESLEVTQLFDFNSSTLVGFIDKCFLNKTYFQELSGEKAMMAGSRTIEVSPHMCQTRCRNTAGCHHFSYWADGGCFLTSYVAHSMLYLGPESSGVISGPASCSNVEVNDGPTLKLRSAVHVAPFDPQEAKGCGGLHGHYRLSWKAQGRTFFDDFQFINKSETHGAEWYLNKSEAFRLGLVKATDDGAVIRVGEQVCPFKRRSIMLHSAEAWRPDQGLVLAMKYKHVPYGPGIWPAFWLVNSDIKWPDGGELDILEYANDDATKVTFHTSKNCSLDRLKLLQCTGKETVKTTWPHLFSNPAVDDDEIPNCMTNYHKNLLGCKPKQVRRTGKWFADNPGVIAVSWDASGVSVFHIPEAKIPDDLKKDEPQPDTWGEHLLAWMPFDAQTCAGIARPQEIVLNIALCGDWAGGAWWNSDEARATGFVPPYCIPGHVTEPATDCCTMYMSSPKYEAQLKRTAYFDIDYMKVFRPLSEKPWEHLSSGTYRNNGESPLQD